MSVCTLRKEIHLDHQRLTAKDANDEALLDSVCHVH
jgi:hypothetical protein